MGLFCVLSLSNVKDLYQSSRGSVTALDTRSQATLINPGARGEIYKNSSSPARSIKEWNELPLNIRNLQLEAPFKLALRAHLNI